MASVAAHEQILHYTGWTAKEIHTLVHERTCPDHWWKDPRPTYGLIEIIRKTVYDSDSLSYRKDFIPILKSMGIEEPKCTLSAILSRVKRNALKAIRGDNLESLCVEFTDFSGSKDVIGSACQQLGITPSWLNEGGSALQGEVSNGIIAELFNYRRQNSIRWKVVLDEWWCRLFPERAAEGYVPSIGTVISSWNSVAKKKQKLSRDSIREWLEEFLRTPYRHPTKRPIKDEQLEDEHADGDEPPLVTYNDNQFETMMEEKYQEVPLLKTELIKDIKPKVYVKQELDENETSCPPYTVLDPLWPSTLPVKTEFICEGEDVYLRENHNADDDVDVDAGVDADDDGDIDAVVDNDGWINDGSDGWISDGSDGWINEDSPSPSTNSMRGTESCQVKYQQAEWIISTTTASEGENQSKISLKDAHEGEIFHECPTCHQRFPFKSLLDEHMTIHVKCSECCETFNSRKDLANHMKVHPSLHKCPECSGKFKSSKDLSEHLKVHRSWPFPSRSLYDLHMATQYKCEKCYKTFNSRKKHTEHMKEHVYVPPSEPDKEVFYECRACHQRFPSNSLLDEHLKIHVKCLVCSEPFPCRTDLKRHEVLHRSGSIRCSYCTETFISNAALLLHMKSQSDHPVSNCSICKKTFATNDTFTQHMKTHKKRPLLGCSRCSLTFTKKIALSRHMKSHSTLTHVLCMCLPCGETFNTKKRLERHAKKTHSNRSFHRSFQLQCLLCTKKFGTMSGFFQHTCKKNQPKEHEYKCLHCSTTFQTASSLCAHVQSHKDRYNCYQCDDKFETKGHLTDHMVNHARRDGGKNPYKCYVCFVAYSKQADLESHFILRHHDELPFQCAFCIDRFSKRGGISRHMTKFHVGESEDLLCYCTQTRRFIGVSSLPEKTRLEIEERPFQCKSCGTRFRMRGFLLNHSRSHTERGYVQCTFCKVRFKGKGQLSKHMKESAQKKCIFSILNL